MPAALMSHLNAGHHHAGMPPLGTQACRKPVWKLDEAGMPMPVALLTHLSTHDRHAGDWDASSWDSSQV